MSGFSWERGHVQSALPRAFSIVVSYLCRKDDNPSQMNSFISPFIPDLIVVTICRIRGFDDTRCFWRMKR